jgi:hypothetical protein
MGRTVVAAAVVVAAMAAGLGVAGAQAGGTIYVVHGVPDFGADVYVDGEAALRGFGYGSVTGGLELPAGGFELDLYPAGADTDATEPALTAKLTVRAGDSLSVVAHLDGDGDPVVTVFPNDLSPVGTGAARLIVRHTAEAPPIDVRAAARPVVTDLSNPEEAVVESLEVTTVPIDLVATGTTEVLYGPADLELEAGMVYIASVVGSVDDANLQVVLQRLVGGPEVEAAQTTTTTLPTSTTTTTTTSTTTTAPAPTTTAAPADPTGGGDPGTPTAVPAGSGGLAGPLAGFPGWALLVAALAVVGVAGSGYVLVSRDRR